jgi:hypothetical protein
VLGSSGCALTNVAITCSKDVLEKLEAVKQEITKNDELLIKNWE